MWRDAVIPVALAALGSVELVSLGVPRLSAAIAVEVTACALLVLRRTATLLVCTTAALTLVALPYLGAELDQPAAPILIAALASFSLARYLPRHRGLLGIVVLILALIATQRITMSPPPDLAGAIFVVAILAPPYAFGWLTRRLADGHALHTELLLERQEALRREAVASERARIARDLHDVLAHSVSAMVVQAEAAADLVPHAPGRAVAALHEVTAAGRSALAETGHLLRLIRDSQDELGLSRDHGLDQLDNLIARFDHAGLRVDVRVDGSLEALPVGVDSAGYRIVQETLTNALKHGRDGRATLTIVRTESAVTIAALNHAATCDQPVGGPQPRGLGLVGMKERVAALGGHLSHELVDGVFAVTACLPLNVEQA